MITLAKKKIAVILGAIIVIVAIITIIILISKKPSNNVSDEKIIDVLPSYEGNQETYKSGEYSLHVNIVDDHSPDRVLSLYKNDKEIKFKEIRYTDGVVLCKYENPVIAVFDLEEDYLVVVLENDEKVEFGLKKDEKVN